MQKKLKALELVQNIVNRLSQNSFLLKGWSVVLLAALLALTAKDESPEYAYLAFVPVMAFWYLDAYFIHHERMFRKLYDHVRCLEEEDIDFSMDFSSVPGIKKSAPAFSKNSIAGTFVSSTLLVFHGTLFATISLVVLLLC